MPRFYSRNKIDSTQQYSIFRGRGDRGGSPSPDFRSEAEHVVEAERAVAAQQPVIAKQAAGRVADYRVGAIPGAGSCIPVEQIMVPEQTRSRTRDRQSGVRRLSAEAIVQDDFGRAERPPSARRRVDQVAERVVVAVAEAQEQSCREARRGAAVGLRFASIDQQRVEDMR